VISPSVYRVSLLERIRQLWNIYGSVFLSIKITVMKKLFSAALLLISFSSAFTQPAGTIIAYAGSKESLASLETQGWVLCGGRLAENNNPRYLNLFRAIGTSWGGDGASKFALPNLQGLFLRGVSENSGNDPDAVNRGKSRPDLNASGNGGNAVGSMQKDEIRSHSHNYSDAHFAEFNCDSGPDKLQGLSGNWDFDNRRCTTNQVTASTGGNETRPKNAYVYYLIRL
jgi:microcystin-dependent protein